MMARSGGVTDNRRTRMHASYWLRGSSSWHRSVGSWSLRRLTGEKRVHVSDNTRNGRRAPALAARPPRGRATAAHGRNGRHAVATAAQQDGAAAVGGQGEHPKVEVQETPVVQLVQQLVATPSKNPST